MAKVSFYLFEKSPERQVESTCRLCRKIMRQAEAKIWLFCADKSLQQEIDDRLWTFDPTSFIPHGIHQLESSICISEHLPTSSDWIIFNFNNQIFENFESVNHVIEIIENNEIAKQLGREKFKQYRKHGIQPQTHKL
ncbi:DNA polymerase III subunit chi [Acinetobacter equi]|uniref:DNA polymerase III subunit chi n=1 Tax=Acinetobacter equi TaxID=1324350 RepID=A0A0N9VBE5_9GAMM|nr:DNA polymerase III subunit chi [Acinetobacter equi]ALH94592.1 DNA polymerase III subunit chi [Acinetobacter equi]